MLSIKQTLCLLAVAAACALANYNETTDCALTNYSETTDCALQNCSEIIVFEFYFVQHISLVFDEFDGDLEIILLNI